MEHLDVKSANLDRSSLQNAGLELVKLSDFLSPKEKLNCIMNSSRHIYDFIGEKGADDFIPTLVYVILQSNPPKLASNTRFISRFLRKSQRSGESFYYYTNLVCNEVI